MISFKHSSDYNEVLLSSMQPLTRQDTCDAKATFTSPSINGTLVRFKHLVPETPVFAFVIAMLKSHFQHDLEHLNGAKHSLKNGLWSNVVKKSDQKVPNNASPQFVVQRQVLSDTSNNQTLIMLKNYSL